MKHYQYKTRGTCSAYIDFDLDDNGVIGDVQFTGGCNGNLQGIGRLVKGRAAAEVIDLLKGTDCDGRGTSCPDQLAKALEAALQK